MHRLTGGCINPTRIGTLNKSKRERARPNTNNNYMTQHDGPQYNASAIFCSDFQSPIG